MPRKCDLCDKGSQRAASRSHSKIKTLRRQKPNLQKSNGLVLCTKCIRTKSKQAA